MIKSKSEPLLFTPTSSIQQAQSAAASSNDGSAIGGSAFRRVPSLGQLQDSESDADAQGLAPDHVALQLPQHLLDVAAVKTVVCGADLFDVAHNCTPAHAQAVIGQQVIAASATATTKLTDDAPQAAAAMDPSPSSHLPIYIKTSASLLPVRVRAPKGDAPPIPVACFRLPWHLELPPVVHTFTLKTEHPGKPGATPHHRDFELSDLSA
jgi:hypothetical protein